MSFVDADARPKKPRSATEDLGAPEVGQRPPGAELPGAQKGRLWPTRRAIAEVIGAGQGSCNQFGQGCLNAAGFATVGTAGTFPTQVRNQFRGPGFFDSDLSVSKNFKLTERMALGVGANLYNVFNHPNFASPIDTFGAGNFGQSVATTAPPTGPYGAFFNGLPSGRIIQFQGKIVF